MKFNENKQNSLSLIQKLLEMIGKPRINSNITFLVNDILFFEIN
jgi:hypothetical protein